MSNQIHHVFSCSWSLLVITPLKSVVINTQSCTTANPYKMTVKPNNNITTSHVTSIIQERVFYEALRHVL